MTQNVHEITSKIKSSPATDAKSKKKRRKKYDKKRASETTEHHFMAWEKNETAK